MTYSIADFIADVQADPVGEPEAHVSVKVRRLLGSRGVQLADQVHHDG